MTQDPSSNVPPDTSVRVNATVTDKVSEIKQVLLNYTYSNDTGTWNNLANMTHLTGNMWNATIPSLPFGTNVTYTILAEDTAGNTITTEQICGYIYEYQVVPEFSSYTALLVFMATVLLLTIISKKKRIFHT